MGFTEKQATLFLQAGRSSKSQAHIRAYPPPGLSLTSAMQHRIFAAVYFLFVRRMGKISSRPHHVPIWEMYHFLSVRDRIEGSKRVGRAVPRIRTGSSEQGPDQGSRRLTNRGRGKEERFEQAKGSAKEKKGN